MENTCYSTARKQGAHQIDALSAVCSLAGLILSSFERHVWSGNMKLHSLASIIFAVRSLRGRCKPILVGPANIV